VPENQNSTSIAHGPFNRLTPNLVRIAALAVCAAWLAAASPSHAALGGGFDSVAADRLHLSAKIASASAVTHTVHTLTLANGSVVREYASPDGVVFAVSWHGAARPDLRQLFGAYFDRFQTDNPLVSGRRTHRPLAADHADFVVRSGGHPGASWGVAWLPLAAPAGFTVNDIQ